MAEQVSGPRPAGWKRDPTGRHYGRWWDGERWTENVISAEKVQGIDPMQPRPPTSAPPPPPPRPAAPEPSSAAPAKGRRVPLWVKIAVPVVVVVAIAASGGDDPSTDVQVSGPASTSEPGPAISALPATSAAPASPSVALRAAVSKALGKGRSGVERLPNVSAGEPTVIEWAIAENLTEGLTKDTARRETTKILQALRDSDADYQTARLVGSFALVDQLGNTREGQVVMAVYDRATVDRINFSGFNFKNVFDIAEVAVIHPSFRY